MHHFRRLVGKKQSSSASAERLKREQENYIKHGSGVLEELLALCDGNCRIPIRYFTAVEIERATQHSDKKIDVQDGYMTVGSLNKRLVIIRFWKSARYISSYGHGKVYRDIAISAQMSHLKNVLRLMGCCLEFETPVTVYEYVEAITLDELLFKKDQTRKSVSWGSRLRIANDVASAVVFLHTEFTTPIIHQDLTPHKVMLDQVSGVAKIMNFSLSVSLPPGELEVVEDLIVGTYGYADPEYLLSGIVTQKTDVYSYGVILLQLLTGKDECLYGGKMIDPRHLENESNIDGWNELDIVDPVILEEHGIAIRQQLEEYFDLVKKCTASKEDDRPRADPHRSKWGQLTPLPQKIIPCI